MIAPKKQRWDSQCLYGYRVILQNIFDYSYIYIHSVIDNFCIIQLLTRYSLPTSVLLVIVKFFWLVDSTGSCPNSMFRANGAWYIPMELAEDGCQTVLGQTRITGQYIPSANQGNWKSTIYMTFPFKPSEFKDFSANHICQRVYGGFHKWVYPKMDDL